MTKTPYNCGDPLYGTAFSEGKTMQPISRLNARALIGNTQAMRKFDAAETLKDEVHGYETDAEAARTQMLNAQIRREQIRSIIIEAQANGEKSQYSNHDLNRFEQDYESYRGALVEANLKASLLLKAIRILEGECA